eukprot:TRINITY_DN200_c0_g2_i4.p1 TRINITY_DN200_c0_g2~~TRINITY_DN200_c0_g2_i4.p1  ORF type:complete len:295 (-),score=-6.97 TRINITY_DN200_c0_g2_i4:359-1243(-)
MLRQISPTRSTVKTSHDSSAQSLSILPPAINQQAQPFEELLQCVRTLRELAGFALLTSAKRTLVLEEADFNQFTSSHHRQHLEIEQPPINDSRNDNKLSNPVIDERSKEKQLNKRFDDEKKGHLDKMGGSRRLPKSAIRVMEAWLRSHEHYPYPSFNEKMKIAKTLPILNPQVQTWFINRRGRMLDKVYQRNSFRAQVRRKLSTLTDHQQIQKIDQSNCNRFEQFGFLCPISFSICYSLHGLTVKYCKYHSKRIFHLDLIYWGQSDLVDDDHSNEWMHENLVIARSIWPDVGGP